MFDHIFEQNAASQLAADMSRSALAPSLLFAGAPSIGKGSTALELSRILSCEASPSPPDCSCGACARHRLLVHPDVLCLGPRPFSAENAAAAAAFTKDPPGKALLFIRSLRKLLLRFSPVLWEDEPKFSKFAGAVLTLEEGVDEIESLKIAQPETIQKRAAAILKNAIKLEAEGIADSIAIGQIRRAAAWARLSPTGRRKTLIIENADLMQDGARNSLLKLLEEPPPSLTIVLTSTREQALLQTVLSRLRVYRFSARDAETETGIIRSLFGDTSGTSRSVEAYLNSFLPVPATTLRPLAALFAASVAMTTLLALKHRSAALPEALVALGKHTAPLAEAAGLGRPVQNGQELIGKILVGADNFELRGLFPRFLQALLTLVGESYQHGGVSPLYYDIWRKQAEVANNAVSAYNQKPGLALERLGTELRLSMTELWG
jgi:DNA polymerase-3 subunit gamma/tau